MKDLPLILLPGWGFSSRVYQPLLHALHNAGVVQVFALDLPGFGAAFHEPCENLDQVVESIVEQLPEKCVLGGWSLGGMLATYIAAKYPARIAGLITLGSNLHFTAQDAWAGMPTADYTQFCQRFAQQPEKTWQRFLGLQTRGDSHSERANALLAALADFQDCHSETALRLLQLLGEIDNRALFSTLQVRGLHIFGAQDAITPAAVVEHLRYLNAQQVVQILPACSHAMPVSRAVEITALIRQFLHQPSDATPKKSQVADSFSRAAITYNQAAQLQKTVGEALLSTLPADMHGVALDLGCGTGFIGGALQAQHAALTVFGVDMASGMLRMAQQEKALRCVQADMEHLPFAAQSADWLLSSLALQWANHLEHCFAEWRRVLRNDGALFFTTFLPNTLQELQQSWRTVDDAVHVNAFIAQEKIAANLRQAGFTQVETVTATHTLYYTQLQDLARELKAIGAHNMNAGRPQGLMGKQRWAKLMAAYEAYRTPRGLPATYEVLYVTAR
jgi:malonyl-CoA O-methyltransferase